MSEAPGMNYAGHYPTGVVYQQKVVSPEMRLECPQIGWHYRVSFDIDARSEARGTTLFYYGDTRFYLSDPISGKLGFSRDGYLNTFDYQFFPGEKVRVSIVGDKEKTSLFVNNHLVSDLPVRKINFGKRGDMYYISTLVFPLQHTGAFNSHITNLKVEGLE